MTKRLCSNCMNGYLDFLGFDEKTAEEVYLCHSGNDDEVVCGTYYISRQFRGKRDLVTVSDATALKICDEAPAAAS